MIGAVLLALLLQGGMMPGPGTSHATGSSPSLVSGQVLPNTCFANSASTLSCSFPNNIGAGHYIQLCLLSDQAGAIGTPTMTGETFVATTDGVNPMSNSSVSANKMACFNVASATGGNKTVSWTGSGNHDTHMHGWEVSGQAASPIDCTNGIAPSSTLSVSCTSTHAADLILAFFGDENSNKTLTVGSGYTLGQLTNNVSGNDCALSEYAAVSSAGSQTAAAGGNSTDAVVQGIVAIKGI